MAKHYGSEVVHRAEVIGSVLTYCVCSVSMILFNKLVIDTYHIDYPMGLLLLQNTCALILVSVGKKCGFVNYPSFDWTVVKSWLPLTILFVLMLWTSMKSLKLMSVAIQTIIKNLAIILTALGDRYYFNKHLSQGMFVAFGMMILGSYIGSSNDQWVTAWGIFWTFANVFSTVAYVLYMRLLLGQVSDEIGRYGPVFYNNLLSLPFILPMCFTQLPDMFTEIASASMGAIFCLLVMVVVSGIMTFASFWCMNSTSPTTYSVTGALNKIPLTLLGIVIFHHHPSFLGNVGIVCALSGGVLYTWFNRPKPVVIDKLEEGRRVV